MRSDFYKYEPTSIERIRDRLAHMRRKRMRSARLSRLRNPRRIFKPGPYFDAHGVARLLPRERR